MKKILPICLVVLAYCSDSTGGVDQALIRKNFKLSASASNAIIKIKDAAACPQVEFSANDSTTFQIRRAENDPPAYQSSFTYSDTEFSNDGAKAILKGNNKSNSNYEITLLNGIYTIDINYECNNGNDTNCIKTSFSCSGPPA